MSHFLVRETTVLMVGFIYILQILQLLREMSYSAIIQFIDVLSGLLTEFV